MHVLNIVIEYNNNFFYGKIMCHIQGEYNMFFFLMSMCFVSINLLCNYRIFVAIFYFLFFIFEAKCSYAMYQTKVGLTYLVLLISYIRDAFFLRLQFVIYLVN